MQGGDSSGNRLRLRYFNRMTCHHTTAHDLVLFSAIRGLWRYSVMTDKLNATMRIAKRVYSLAQDQNDSELVMGAYSALAVTLFYLGDFEPAHQNAMRGIEIWRSGGVQSPVE